MESSRPFLIGLGVAVLLGAVGVLSLPAGRGTHTEWRPRRPRPTPPPIESRPLAALRARDLPDRKPFDPAPALHLRIEVRGEDDAGIADASLTVRSEEGVQMHTTGPNGHAAVDLRHAGRVLVHAAADGYDDASLEAEVGDAGGNATIVLRRAGGLGGRVLGYRGRPEDLTVLAARADDPGQVRSAAVLPDGGFRFAPLPGGRYVVGLQPAGFEERLVEAEVVPGEQRDVDLTLAPIGAVDVTAWLPQPSPASRAASLRLVRSDPNRELTRPLMVTSGVSQRVDALPVGPYAVELTVPGLAQRPFQTVEVTAEQVAALRFAWPESRIVGRVAGGRRRAQPARVSAYKLIAAADERAVRDNNPEVAADADREGFFTLPGLSAGHYLVVAEREPAVVSAEVELAEGEARTVDLTLEPGHTIVARVHFRGAPIAGARVFATRAPYAESSRSADTDARGLVRLQHLAGGPYAIRAVWLEGEGGPLRQARADVDLDRDGGAVELELD